MSVHIPIQENSSYCQPRIWKENHPEFTGLVIELDGIGTELAKQIEFCCPKCGCYLFTMDKPIWIPSKLNTSGYGANEWDNFILDNKYYNNKTKTIKCGGFRCDFEQALSFFSYGG